MTEYKLERQLKWDADVLHVKDVVKTIKDDMSKQFEEFVLDHFDADMSDFREYMHDKIKWERKQELAMPRWILVTEQPPEENVAVNVVWVNHKPESYYTHIKDKPFTATAVYFRGRWYWWSATIEDILAEYGDIPDFRIDSAIEITHWAAIPEPPKEPWYQADGWCEANGKALEQEPPKEEEDGI